MEPSVKGSLFVAGVVAVRRHRDSGRISADQIAARLGPVALEMLEQKIDISRWYPIDVFCELVDLDWEILGGRNPDYLRRIGELTAARFFRTGLYQQLDYAKRGRQIESRSALLRRSKLITSVTDTLYDFLEVDVQLQKGFLEIVYRNAERFSEGLRYTTEGFMNEINRQQGSSRCWTSERVAPDRVCFRLGLPKRLQEND